MKEKAFEKATEYIDAMAAKLGVAAEHVYGLLVRQQIAEGVADTLIGVVALAIFITLIVSVAGAYLKPKYIEEGEGYYRKVTPANAYARLRELISDSDGLFYLPFTIVLVLSAVIGIAFLYGGVLALINPEYYAIKEILDTLGGK